MKRLTALLIAMLLVFGAVAVAEDLQEKTKDELIEMVEALQAENAELKAQLGMEDDTEEGEADEAEAEESDEAEAEEGNAELARGARGDEVVQLQQALQDLGYLSGSADGDFGGGTESAVADFQSQNGLEVTGVADESTLTLLYSGDAQRAIVYEELDYEGVSLEPSQFTDHYVRFNGRVRQVIEDGGYVAFRIATSGSNSDIVFVVMPVPEDYEPIQKEDRVTVEGQYADLYSYETVRGETLTIPRVNATLVTLR